MKMKPLILAGAFLACVTPAEAADAWTCSFLVTGEEQTFHNPEPASLRLEVVPPDVIDDGQKHYRILQDNDVGLVATNSWSELDMFNEPRIGATTIVINKQSGEFWWGNASAGPRIVAGVALSGHGTCRKN
jgi:hypothetical protein